MKLFYRVGNIETNQGLWYDWEGRFTGLIHTRFDFCENSELPMSYDTNLINWLSVVDELDNLWFWFSKEDVYELQKEGWYPYVYQAEKWKMYDYDDQVSHPVIDQYTSKPILRIVINDSLEIGDIQTIKSTESGILTK